MLVNPNLGELFRGLFGDRGVEGKGGLKLLSNAC